MAAARRDALRAEHRSLLSRAEAHESDLRRRDDAGRAQGVLPCVTGAEAAAVACTESERLVRRARDAAPADLRELLDGIGDEDIQRKTLLVERDTCTALAGALRRLVVLEAGLPARWGDVSAGEAARLAKAQERDRLMATRAGRPAERQVLVSRLEDAVTRAAALPAAQQSAEVARTRLDAASDVVTLSTRVLAAEELVRQAAAAAQRAVLRAAELHRLRIAGIAGELAEALVPGEPCAVCGGTEHPAPAPRDPEHVTVEDVEDADQDRQLLAAALIEAAEALTVHQLSLEVRRAAAGGLDQEAARDQLGDAVAAVADAEQACTLRDGLSAQVTRFDSATEQMDAQIAALGVEVASEGARLASTQTQVVVDEAEVVEARGDAGSVRERADALGQRIAQVTAWADALGRLEDSRSQLAVRTAELQTALLENGFAESTAVRAASLDAPALERLDRSISTYENALAAVRSGLEEQEVLALPEVVEVDVAGAEAAHAAADGEATEAAREAARLRQRADAAGAARAELARAVTALQVAHQDAEPVVRMANLAAASGGDNAEQLTLATYVLARRFDDVVAAANARLVTMSDGRYELTRSSEKEDVRARKRGLAMKVVDHQTESERDPRTLSGGETFYVSLCLALGLADVVTAEAGGIDLGTLFVDEGFGSLDQETLDVVLGELSRLRDGGRVVGVVSHVEALKQAIAERVEVRRCPDGSSTLSVRA